MCTAFPMFQCSSASRKFLNQAARVAALLACAFQCSSASRKFLNKLYVNSAGAYHEVSVLFSEPKIPQSFKCFGTISRLSSFQCSSASRKFLNFARECTHRVQRLRFSALQRAENSSIEMPHAPGRRQKAFQCSSASRKFLNHSTRVQFAGSDAVSVLFSEPKIPQFW